MRGVGAVETPATAARRAGAASARAVTGDAPAASASTVVRGWSAPEAGRNAPAIALSAFLVLTTLVAAPAAGQDRPAEAASVTGPAVASAPAAASRPTTVSPPMAAFAAVSPPTTAPTVADSTALAEASAAFSRAYVTGDTARIRDLYTDDAMLLPPERTVVGPEAIARYFAPRPQRENTHHAMVSERLEVTGPVAVDVGRWHNRWRVDGGPEQEASGVYLVVWRLGADGRWRMQYDAWHRPAG